MHTINRRNPWWLICGITGISGLGWLINTYEPTKWYILLVFFLLVFLSCTALSYYLLNNVRRAFLLGSGLAAFLFLRYLLLREAFYVLLLLACLVSLELYLNKR